MVVTVFNFPQRAIGWADLLFSADKTILAVPRVVPAAIRKDIAVVVVGERLLLRRGVDTATRRLYYVRRIGAGRVDHRHDAGEGIVRAVGVVGLKGEVPRHGVGGDVVAQSGVAVDLYRGGVGRAATQPHRVGVRNGRVLVEGVGGVGLHEGLSTDDFGSGCSVPYRVVIVAESATAVNL